MDLKKELDGITLPANASIFTYEVLSMYINIDTEECIARIEQYLWLPATHFRFYHKHPRVIIADMALVMRNNRMRFGDLIIHQIKGIAMGMLPAPTIANLFVAIYEAEHIVPKIRSYLLLLRRFIDDGFGVWLHKTRHHCRQGQLDGMPGTGERNVRSQKVVFMDLTIEIVNRRFVTLLYAKPMALYLYIPPNSSHAPGTLTGLVYGQVLRIYQLCSLSTYIDKELATFYRRLLARGYHAHQILPLFKKGINNACAHLSRTDEEKRFIAQAKEEALQQGLFFHLPFHPQLPPSAEIQRLWRQHISTPLGELALHQLKKVGGYPIPVKQLTVAYRRDLNLGNVLAYRRLCQRKGPKVSSYLNDISRGK